MEDVLDEREANDIAAQAESMGMLGYHSSNMSTCSDPAEMERQSKRSARLRRNVKGGLVCRVPEHRRRLVSWRQTRANTIAATIPAAMTHRRRL